MRGAGRIRRSRLAIALVLLPTALPAAAQTTLGLRAGLGSARMVVMTDDVVYGPCPPNSDCPGFLTGSARALTFGADLGVQLPSDAVEIRVGATYAAKGGAAVGRTASGEPLRGRVSPSYLQLSSLLRARTSGRLSVGILFGPWVAIRLWCGENGRGVDGRCGLFDADMPDAGFAVGGGVELAVSGRLSIGVDAISYHGLTALSSYKGTRFVAIQAGVVVPIG